VYIAERVELETETRIRNKKVRRYNRRGKKPHRRRTTEEKKLDTAKCHEKLL
jgi:hypothetical protein